MNKEQILRQLNDKKDVYIAKSLNNLNEYLSEKNFLEGLLKECDIAQNALPQKPGQEFPLPKESATPASTKKTKDK